MRKGELFALQKKDIDLDKGVIHITKSYQRINKKDVIHLRKHTIAIGMLVFLNSL